MTNEQKKEAIKNEIIKIENAYQELKKANLPNHEHRMQFEKLALQMDIQLAKWYKF